MTYTSGMKMYLQNPWLLAALALVIFGGGPLFAVLFLASVGLWPDPDPNPIGPGMLFFVTMWPAVVCFRVGLAQLRRRVGAR